MLREEYGHNYRKCPVCKKEGLPPGIIVCCQNEECTHVINTEKEPWEDKGIHEEPIYDKNGNIIPKFLYERYKPVEIGYEKIAEFVNKLPQKDMVLLDMVMKDRRRRYGG